MDLSTCVCFVEEIKLILVTASFHGAFGKVSLQLIALKTLHMVFIISGLKQ